jgi:ubiquinone/menaquinone biosynthesis C-methylase UbiE
MDIYHKIMEVARRGKLHEAPIPVHSADPPRILDLGCGTGIWAIDMAEYVVTFCFRPATDAVSILANTRMPKYAPTVGARMSEQY